MTDVTQPAPLTAADLLREVGTRLYDAKHGHYTVTDLYVWFNEQLATLDAERAARAPEGGELTDYQRGYIDGFDAPVNAAARAPEPGEAAAREFLESITAFRPVDAELVNATLAELAESPLPGARYAYEVVKRRFAAALQRAARAEPGREAERIARLVLDDLARHFESQPSHVRYTPKELTKLLRKLNPTGIALRGGSGEGERP